MQAKKPTFLTSAQNINQAPSPIYSEIAFLGRSNVGKSSLLNLLLGTNLAKSSNTPGKTQLINFFRVEWQKNDEERFPLVLVDLPGFGYAKVSKDLQSQWQKNLGEFLEKRTNIKLFLHLRDSRHTALPLDEKVLGFLQHLKNPDQEILTLYTKADKLNQNAIAKLTSNGALLTSTEKKSHSKILNASTLRALILNKTLGI
ncbi:MAG: ribosome biogenesis GTP-binding protein YihA/YsxC [Helicobacter sp.]|uniref:ribosome biogenesis GTP-binding protein YihA/YsxC n=1 Tax=Helicobacter sp. 10-6591 TaxID=2004998 RepID=UPI000DCBEA32|nr:ribosome biogenesis GTP-binding protein YihA/YsxC [Helicobacter sp. 10-6591]MCI6217393.1 ribosome biogenesis GTP-binding protein YihA/YsxC [Helicobacter sp.]MCI7485781.1 ribosome biogenesis GTP-binding protein YihA/YsxC [Helicobacter sp.]RAX53220.1 hypothetical protein CCY97_07055 [Helicobacter sp. 10-6591]